MMMISDSVYQDYLAALLRGDLRACDSCVRSLLNDGLPVKTLYVHLFQRSMYQIGTMWEYNQISVADEHVATAITESLFSLVYPLIFAIPRNGLKALISCVANEYHQIGGKMVADTLEMRGWDAFFLGANTPVQDLLHILDEKKPDFVGLSLAVYFSFNSLLSAVKQIRSNFHRLPILVGGQAFRWGGPETLDQIQDVTYAATLDKMKEYVKIRFEDS